MKSIEERVNEIREANDAYRKGNPIMTDHDYDLLVEILFELDPDNDWFKKGIQDKVKGRKQKLHLPMYSLEKVKTYEEIKKWIESCNLKSSDKLIITPKYDGISLCVNDVVGHALTRGDGEYGQDCSEHYKLIKGSQWEPKDFDQVEITFGEAIFKTIDFLKVKEDAGYKSARNAVAGLINASEVNPILSHVTYVRYGCNREDWSKQQQLDFLNEATIPNSQVQYTLTTVGSLVTSKESFVELMNELFEKLTSGYKCDGLVIDVNDPILRKELGRLPNNNPKYAIAYKNPDWSEREETIVKSVDWQISKDGRLAPVINIEPVDLCGATVSRCTAYNARYIKANFISKNARVIIARSGDVIPKHLKTIKSCGEFDSITPKVCPVCGKELSWDENKVDLICKNVNCNGVKLAKCVYFFSILDFKEFREPTIKKLFNIGYDTPSKILNLTEEDLKKIEGLGNVAAKVLSKQFEEFKKKGTNFAKFLTACNVFNGVIAEKTCQKILNGLKLHSYPDIYSVIAKLNATDIEKEVEGVGFSTAASFIQGIANWWVNNDIDIPITYYGQEEKTFEGQMTVVFTGFRDKDFERQLIDKGHKIGSSVSKKTSCVVTKIKGSGSTKESKAEQLGIPIFTLQEFKEKFLM